MTWKSRFSLPILTVITLMFSATVVFPAVGPARATHLTKKVTKVTLKVRRPTNVADTTLNPGKYTVKIIPAPNGSSEPTLQFWKTAYTQYHPYVAGSGVAHEELVLTIKASAKDISAAAMRTELILASRSSNYASSLKIRGSSTEYIFDANATSGGA